MKKLFFYHAKDNSGYIIYNIFTGETNFFETAEELEQYKALNNKDTFTVPIQ
jgi:hypothetical protein